MESIKAMSSIDAKECVKLNQFLQSVQKTIFPLQPVLRTASSLQSIALNYLVKLLESHCGKPTFSQNKPVLRHIMQTQLPLTVRQELLNLALHEGRIYNLHQLHLLELLLFPDTTSLVIHTVRSWYRISFLQILAQQGQGLQHLRCDDPNWTPSNNNNNGPHLALLLCQTLGRLTQLRTASLRYFADDNLLAVVGAQCPQLRILDVTGSHAVTDDGLRRLSTWEDCEKIQSELNDTKPTPKRTRKSSMEVCFLWMPKLAHGLRLRRHSWSWTQSKSHAPALVNDSNTVGLQDPSTNISKELSTEKAQQLNSCTGTLLFVRTSGTQVTQPGLSDLQQRMPQVQCS